MWTALAFVGFALGSIYGGWLLPHRAFIALFVAGFLGVFLSEVIDNRDASLGVFMALIASCVGLGLCAIARGITRSVAGADREGS